MTNDFKVVHIASGDIWAGAEAQLFSLTKYIHDHSDIIVYVILLNHGILEEKLKNIGVKTYIIDEKKKNGFLILKSLITLLLQLRPQITHTHGFKENILGSIASRFIKNTKSLRTEHGAPEFAYPAWVIHKYLVGKLNIFLGRYFQSKIIAVSKDLQEILNTLYTSKNTVLIENGIDIEQLVTQSKEEVTLPYSGKAINCALICRLVEIKRPELVILIADHFVNKKHYKNIRFYIFGDGPLYEILTNLISDLKLKEYVYLMGFKHNVPAYLKKMDISLITSDHEGLPINLLESMVLGTYVISHAVGGIPNVLENGEYGTLVPEQNVQMYVQAIEDAIPNISTPKRNDTLSYIKNKYSIKEVSKRYINLYKSLHVK